MINNREIYQMQKDIEALKLKEPDFSITTGVKFNLTPSSFTLDETLGRYKANLNHNLNKDVEGFSISFYTEDKESVFFDYKILDTNNIEIHSDEPVAIIVSIKQGVECEAHNHDLDYSKLNHNHDGTYSETGHLHDETYSKLDHTHENSGGDNKIKTLEEFKAAVASKNKIIELESGIEIVLDETIVIDFETHIVGSNSIIDTDTLEIGILVKIPSYKTVRIKDLQFKTKVDTDNQVTTAYNYDSTNQNVIDAVYNHCGLAVINDGIFYMSGCMFDTLNVNKLVFKIIESSNGSSIIENNVFTSFSKISFVSNKESHIGAKIIFKNNTVSLSEIAIIGTNISLKDNNITSSGIAISNNSSKITFSGNAVMGTKFYINYFIKQTKLDVLPTPQKSICRFINFIDNNLQTSYININCRTGLGTTGEKNSSIMFNGNYSTGNYILIKTDYNYFNHYKFYEIITNTYTKGDTHIYAKNNESIEIDITDNSPSYHIEALGNINSSKVIKSNFSKWPIGIYTENENTTFIKE